MKKVKSMFYNTSIVTLAIIFGAGVLMSASAYELLTDVYNSDDTLYYMDADNDGFCDESIATTTPDIDGYIETGGDCDDTNASTSPAVMETEDGIDNDCDGEIDEDFYELYYLDADGDTYGYPTNSTSSLEKPEGYVANNNDCDDTDADVNPSAEEIKNDGIDNNCDGVALEDNNDCPNDCGGCQLGCGDRDECSNNGGYVSCMTHWTNQLKWMGEISGKEKGQIMSNVAKNKFEYKFEFEGRINDDEDEDDDDNKDEDESEDYEYKYEVKSNNSKVKIKSNNGKSNGKGKSKKE